MGPELIHSEKGMRRMSGEMVVIDRHLYLTEDKTRVVEEGDPASRWLWASPGQEMSREEAERLGAVKRARAPEPEPEPEVDVVESKAQSKPEDKAMRPPENKATSESRKVREWAAAEGLDVPARGRIPADVLDAYRAAHEG